MKTHSFVFVDDNSLSNIFVEALIKRSKAPVSATFFQEEFQAYRYLLSMEEALLPDCIVADIHLSMSTGFEFLENLVGAKPQIQKRTSLFITSALLNPDSYQVEMAAPYIAGFFPKPFSKASLESLLRASAPVVSH